jgi:hypothetical protein
MENYKISKYDLEHLKHGVIMVNDARTFFNREVPKIQAILKPFLGKKVLNADGSIAKKLNDLIKFDEVLLKPFEEDGRGTLDAYMSVTSYNVRIQAKLCYNGGSYDVKPSTAYCVYHDAIKYVGRVEDGILISLEELEEVPLLDFETELKQYCIIEELKEKLKIEEEKLFYELRNKRRY